MNCALFLHFISIRSLPFKMSAGSSRIRLILRAHINSIHRQIAHHFKLPPATPSKIDASTPTEGLKRFVRNIPIGPSALQHPPTLVDTPVFRKSAVRRDTCPTTIASTTSLYSVAVNRPAIDTWPDHHPRTTTGYLVPRHRAISSPLPNVCWHRHPPHRPPHQRLVSVCLAFPERKPENVLKYQFLFPINIYSIANSVICTSIH